MTTGSRDRSLMNSKCWRRPSKGCCRTSHQAALWTRRSAIRRPVSAGRAASVCTVERPSVREPTGRTSRQFDCEARHRRDGDVDLRTKPDADLDAFRPAFVGTIWTRTRGVSDPARRGRAESGRAEGRVAHAPTPPPSPFSSVGGPAGTGRRPLRCEHPRNCSLFWLLLRHGAGSDAPVAAASWGSISPGTGSRCREPLSAPCSAPHLGSLAVPDVANQRGEKCPSKMRR